MEALEINQTNLDIVINTWKPKLLKSVASIDVLLINMKKKLSDEHFVITQLFYKKMDKIGFPTLFGNRIINLEYYLKKMYHLQEEINASNLPTLVKEALLKATEIHKLGRATILVKEKYLWHQA